MQAGKILSGTILRGEYVLLGPIGDSGNDVFRAHHQRDNRSVAVRLWRSEPNAPPRDLNMAQTAILMRHGLLGTVEACGRERDGLVFLVSEYVAGQRLDQWADSVGIPPLGTVIDYVHRLCVALHMVHRAGFAHGAVNPRNLVMMRGGGAPGHSLNAKLLDVGVPAFMRSKPPRIRSALFMAPEQLAAAVQPGPGPTFETDCRVDVYGCGSLLYYLTTGGAPHPSRSLRELLANHAAGTPPSPSRINPAIPVALDEIILRALSPNPRERYRDGAELAGALLEVRRSSSVSGVMPSVQGSSAPGQESGQEPPSIVYEGDFEERPTSGGPSAAALMETEAAKSTAPAAEDLTAPGPDAARADAARDDDTTTTRPSHPSAPAGSFSDVAPAPASVPGMLRSLDPLAPPTDAGQAKPWPAAPPPSSSETGRRSAVSLKPPPARGSRPPPLPVTPGPPVSVTLPVVVPDAAAQPHPNAATAPALPAAPTPLVRTAAAPPASGTPAVVAPATRATPTPGAPAVIVPVASAAAARAQSTALVPIASASRAPSAPATSVAPVTLRKSLAAAPARWRPREVLLWASVAAACITGFFALERWDTPAKIARSTTSSQLRVVQLKPRPADEVVPVAKPAPTTAPPEMAPARDETADSRSVKRDVPPPSPRPKRAPRSSSVATASVPTPASQPRTAQGERSTAIQRALAQRAISPAQRAVVEALASAPATRADGAEGAHEAAAPDAPESSEQGARGASVARRIEPLPATTPKSDLAAAPDAKQESKQPAQPLAADVQALELEVHGSLATSEVRRAIERIRPQLAACYARAAKGAGRNAFGSVSVDVVIDEAGRAHNPHARGQLLPDLDRCVEQAAGSLVSTRAPDTGTVKASWRVVFAPRSP